MATNELDSLVRTLVGGLAGPIIKPAHESSSASVQSNALAGPDLLQLIEWVSGGPDAQRSAATPSGSEVGRLVAEVEQLRRAVTDTASTQASAKAVSGARESDDGNSTASTVLKTIGMVTGIGPIATGLLSLFGSKSSSEPSFPTMPFEPPPPIALEAGLGADRQFTGISYAADGSPRSTSSNSNAGHASRSVPPIQINVQAMDSRSFLDRSDDIARAVREAMLHSHALNDVVSEL